jgi:hypothetical protein
MNATGRAAETHWTHFVRQPWYYCRFKEQSTMTDPRTFYCPRCGNRIAAMPGQAIGCPRCGRAVWSPLISSPLQPLPLPVAVPLRQPGLLARPVGTPGIGVALLMYFFFPVGLYLLWTHPNWTEKQKWKYTIIWLAIVAGLFVSGLLAMMIATIAF